MEIVNFFGLKNKTKKDFKLKSHFFSVNFNGTDTEEAFEENLKIMSKDWSYREKKIVYNFNSDGYRTYDFNTVDWKNSIVVLGCSCVFGAGLAEDETISYNLEQLTGRQTINMGVSGASNELIINNCVCVFKLLFYRVFSLCILVYCFYIRFSIFYLHSHRHSHGFHASIDVHSFTFSPSFAK